MVHSSSPIIGDGIDFWEGIIAAENNHDVKDEQHSEEMNVDIPVSQTLSQLQVNGTAYVDDAISSTDSIVHLDEGNHVVHSTENVIEPHSNSQPIYENPLVSEGMFSFYMYLRENIVQDYNTYFIL